MSSSSQSPPARQRRRPADGSPAGGSPPPSKRPRARLSEEQKKLNHIESEQKRREAIRLEFDILADLVPGMAGQGRSEATVMHASVGHLRQLLIQRSQLVSMAKQRGLNTTKWDFAGLDVLVDRARVPPSQPTGQTPTPIAIPFEPVDGQAHHSPTVVALDRLRECP